MDLLRPVSIHHAIRRSLLAIVALTTLTLAGATAADGYLQEAPLPEGWPAPAEPGVIELVVLPAHRAAEADGFWTLYRHISSNDIPMTAPVVMAMDQASGESAPRMRFLYPATATTPQSTSASVQLVDEPPVQVLRVSLRGAMEGDRVKEQLKRLRDEADHRRLTVAGDPLLHGYNGPMTRSSKRTWSIAMPVIDGTAELAPGRLVVP